MSWRRFIVAVLAGSMVSAFVSAVGHRTGLIGYVQEPIAWVLPSAVPDAGFWTVVNAAAGVVVAVPGLAVAIGVYAMRPGGTESRCRRCGYMNRGG